MNTNGTLRDLTTKVWIPIYCQLRWTEQYFRSFQNNQIFFCKHNYIIRNPCSLHSVSLWSSNNEWSFMECVLWVSSSEILLFMIEVQFIRLLGQSLLSLHNDQLELQDVLYIVHVFAGNFEMQHEFTSVKTLNWVTNFLHRGSFKIISDTKNQQPWLIWHEFKPHKQLSVVSLSKKLLVYHTNGFEIFRIIKASVTIELKRKLVQTKTSFIEVSAV